MNQTQTPNRDLPGITKPTSRRRIYQDLMVIIVAIIIGIVVYIWLFSDQGNNQHTDQSIDLPRQRTDTEERQAAKTQQTKITLPKAVSAALATATAVTSSQTSPKRTKFQRLVDFGEQDNRSTTQSAEERQARRGASSAIFVQTQTNTVKAPNIQDAYNDLFSNPNRHQQAAIDPNLADANLALHAALDTLNASTPVAESKRNAEEDAGLLSIPIRSYAPVVASLIADLSYRVLQGTLIDFVLETAIDSTLSGLVRGMTIRDIYSADGSQLLIPKYSRLIGEYQSGIRQGEARVFIIWNRLITQQGIDIQLASVLTDALGRSGFSGNVDSHFFTRFGSSILLSMIGGVTQKEAGDEAQRQAYANAFNEASAIALENSINVPPTITIDQGKQGFVFVARDLDFTEAYKQLTKQTAIRSKQKPLPPYAYRTRAERLQAAKQFNIHLHCQAITLEKGQLLSILIKGYFDQCGFVLKTWNVENDYQPIDYRLKESIRIQLPGGIQSLQQFLFETYQVRLVLLSENIYVASNISTHTQDNLTLSVPLPELKL